MSKRMVLALGALLFCATSARAADLDTCFHDHGDVAIKACTRVIQTTRDKQDRADAYGMRGYHYNAKDDYTSGLADADKSIALVPTQAYVYDNRSNAERMLGKFDAALSDANKALKLDPEDLPAHLNRGLVEDFRGDYAKAIEDFTVFIKRSPDPAEPFTFRGWVYRETGHFDLALADFQRAIELGGDGSRPHIERGKLYLQLKKYHLALADFSDAILIKPNSAPAFYGRGLAKLGLHDKAARADFDRARALNRNIESDYSDPHH